jgi:hypothetical protein
VSESIAPDGPKQSAIALLFQRVDCLVRQRRAGFLERVEAGIEIDKGKF